MTNFRDIENLSAYLDGQLSETESKRLKNRLETDAELDSVLSDIRSARNILKALPKRKSPKNFMLTRKMVGLNPPMPRTYPLFRLATIFATVLLVFSFSINTLTPYVSFGAPQFAFGYGSGGGGAAAPAAPAAEESMMFEAAPAEDATTEEAAEILPQSTDTTRIAEEPIPTLKEAESGDSGEALENPVEVQNEAVFPSIVVFTFLIISILGAISMFVIRQNARRKWQ